MDGAAPPPTRRGISWAGILAGPGAWALSFQANYALVPWRCASQTNIVPWLSAAGVLAALIGGWLSYRALRDPVHGIEPPLTGRTRSFLAGIGVAAALLFALVMVLQGAAGLLFDGCER